MTKRQGETSYKETAFGIIPRSKLIPLEIEGIKRAWDFILKKRKKIKIPIIAGREPRTFSAGMNDRKAISSFCGRGGDQEVGILPAHES